MFAAPVFIWLVRGGPPGPGDGMTEAEWRRLAQNGVVRTANDSA
jgi:hypothetical protein